MNLFAIVLLCGGILDGAGAAALDQPAGLMRETGLAGGPTLNRTLDQPARSLSSPVSRESGPRDGLHAGLQRQIVRDDIHPRHPAIVFASEPARLPMRNAAALAPVNPILGPTGGQPGDIILLDASQAKAKAYAWDCIPLNLDAQGKPLTTIVALGDKAIVSSRPGTRTAILSIVRDDGTIQLFQWTVTISGTPTPQPPEPKPDDPPKPPKPEPPKPAGGLRVVVVRETGDASKVDAVFAKIVRDYLKAKCVKDSAGNPEFRVWDDDQQFSDKESYTLREMFQKAQPFQVLPALILQNDANPTAKAMPLPSTPDDLLAELRKWGGQ